jgi:ubiquinone/menaquinone biosynthesis C-methylase UbiE
VPSTAPLDPIPGQAVYTPGLLAIYDTAALRIILPLGWGCPLRRIRDLYERHVCANHLDVGVGTGYFLKHCTRLKPGHQVTLLDMNPNSLRKTAERLRPLAPATIQANVLEPIALPAESFDSVSMTQLLHCLPGSLADKAPALANVATLMRPGAVLFGTTVLWRGERHNLLGRKVLRSYDEKGIYSNRDDDQDGLRTILEATFARYDVTMFGRIAAFIAWKD